MHATLTDHARCLFGDEYRPTPPCDRQHDEACFIEELTFADTDAILAMLRELCPDLVDGYLPVRIRNLAYRLALLQRPDDPALMREAAGSLYFTGPTGTTSPPISNDGPMLWMQQPRTGRVSRTWDLLDRSAGCAGRHAVCHRSRSSTRGPGAGMSAQRTAAWA
ncbi:hypothetical protein [Streptomyces sp. NBC_01767]|uniref:hypothetical protein n=1 Tax=Streptomyces sp. NBC_01767 TaxID=2975937 RepID=UPI002B1CDBBF|nr:hypothetical protein [Streptomyces sp. NBC_01767]